VLQRSGLGGSAVSVLLRSLTKSRHPQVEAPPLFQSRSYELDVFIQDILTPQDPQYNIVAITGQQGVGKSTLLDHFIEKAQKQYCLTALVDQPQAIPTSMMADFADQFRIAGVRLAEFEKELARYKEQAHSMEAARELPIKSELQRKPLIWSGVELPATPREPTRPAIFSRVWRELMNTASYLLDKYLFPNRHALKQYKKAERLADPVGILTEAFVRDLNRLTRPKVRLKVYRAKHPRRVILFFDSFEQLADEAARWLLERFLDADISKQVVLVVAGIDPMGRSIPNTYKHWSYYTPSIHTISLQRLSLEETTEYLAKRQITDPNHIEMIWHLSGGLPLYLSLLTANAEGDKDPAPDLVTNFLRWIPDGDPRRRLALYASLLSMPFRLDDLKAFNDFTQRELPALYRWLVGLSFVRGTQDGRFSYHSQAQILFGRYFYQHAQDKFYTVCENLVAYYKRRLEIIERKHQQAPSSAEWLETTLALVYQLFLLPEEASYVEAAVQILAAYERTRQPEEITTVLSNLSQESLHSLVGERPRLIVRSLLNYIEADRAGEKEKMVGAIKEVLEQVAPKHSSISDVLRPGVATLYCKRGNVSLLLKDYQGAINDYARALRLDPGSGEAYLGRGVVYKHRQLYERAIADFDRAIKLDATCARAYDRRGDTYRRLNKHQEALADFNRALNLGPTAEMYIGRGIVYRDKGAYEQAIDDYEAALRLDPDSADAYTKLAEIYRLHNKHGQAIACLDRALALEPRLATAYSQRGIIYSDLKDYERAIEDFDTAIELDPDFAGAYDRRGETYRRLNDYDRAIKDLDRALQLDEHLARAYVVRGEIFCFRRNFKRAIDDFDSAIRLDPTFARAYGDRGEIYRQRKEYDQALADLDRAINLDSTISRRVASRAYASRARTYRLRNEYERAIDDFNHSLELDPAAASVYMSRGEAYRSCGFYQQALADFDRATKLDSKLTRAYFYRGAAYSDLKEYERALADFDRALALEPNYAEVYAHRGIAYRKRKEYQRALTDFDRALELKPDMLLACLQRGITYRLSQRYQQAIADFTHMIERDPKSANAYAERGVVYRKLKEYSQATIDFDHALALNSRLAWVYVERGRTYRLRNHPIEAIADLGRALSLDATLVRAYVQRGIAYLDVPNLPQARADFLQSQTLDPTGSKGVQAGWMAEWTRMCQEGRDDGLAERLDAITGDTPQFYEGLACQGVALWLRGRFEEALTTLEQACLVKPDEWDTLFWKGMAAASLGRAEEARAALNQSLEEGMPHVLLEPLRWLAETSPDFYEQYAAPLLASY